MKAPVSLCIIVKNEPLLEQCLLSVREFVEEIIIVDNGTTDPEVLRVIDKYADIHQTFTKCNDPRTGLIEDFSMLRNRAFSLATCPYAMWCDADDVIEGMDKLHGIIEAFMGHAVYPPAPIAFSFPYQIYDTEGNVNLRFYRERLFYRPTEFKWVDPVHEVVLPAQDNLRDELVWHHRKVKTAEPGRNLRILLAHHKRVGSAMSPRMLFYLASEEMDHHLDDDAIKHLTKYVSIGSWEDELVMACLKLSKLHHNKNDLDNMLKWSLKAVEIKEIWGECYFAVGRCFYFKACKGDWQQRRYWEKAVHWIKLGLQQPPTKTKLFINPNEREVDIHRFLNFAMNKIGDVRGALASVLTAMKKVPNDPGFLQNMKIYQEHLGLHNINNKLFATNDNMPTSV